MREQASGQVGVPVNVSGRDREPGQAERCVGQAAAHRAALHHGSQPRKRHAFCRRRNRRIYFPGVPALF